MRMMPAILFLCAAPSFALGEWGLSSYGYEGRANGMDWNDNFAYGDAQDGLACDDANGAGATIVSEDIDGDGDAESQIYVIPATGSDDADCGGPNNADACATVQYAYDNRMDTGSHEDVICLVGTAHESLSWTDKDGDAGVKTRTATGDEVYDFQYPSNPNVLMGADRDGDGNYPPHDTDDIAVFDGEVGASYLETFLSTSDGVGTIVTSRWEFAHLTVREYGTNDATRDPATKRGLFMHGGSDPNYIENHTYYHDIYAYRINYRQEQLSFTQVLYELWGRQFNYAAIENVACIECCGYISRGNTGQDPSYYLRVTRTTLTWECEDVPEQRIDISPGTGSVKHWGNSNHIEYLNNYWDLDVSSFVSSRNDANDHGSGAYGFNTCIRDVYVVNNIVKNGTNCFKVGGGLKGQCTAQPGDNINFLRNYCVIDVSEASGGFPRALIGTSLKPGFNSRTIYTKDITVANNFFLDLTGEGYLSTVFQLTDGVPSSGPDPSGNTIAFINNTGYSANWGETTSPTEAPIFSFDDDADDRPHSYVIKNNVIAGGASDDWFIRFLSSGVDGDSLDMDYNIYEDNGGDREFWAPDGTRYQTLALYSAATGLETHSKGEGQNACDVTFVNRGSDMHLSSSDTCAQEYGVSASAYTTVDHDDDSRPQGTNWDIGADEWNSAVFSDSFESGSCSLWSVCFP
ncbi:MAG: hypothetical protein WBQ30_19975 [Thermoanaerobaculia bacterium]